MKYSSCSLVTLGCLLISCQPLNDLEDVSRGTGDTRKLDPSTGSPDSTSSLPNTSEPAPTNSPGESASAAPSSDALTLPDESLPGASSMDDAGTSETSSATFSNETLEVTSRSDEAQSTAPQVASASSSDSTAASVDTSTLESTGVTQTEGNSSETTGEPSSCDQDCALGDPCSTFTDCASLRCTDETCAPTELRVDSSGIDAVSTSIKMHVELYADPAVPVAWSDLAVLYFFTVEKRDDFVAHFSEGGGSALPMQVTLTEWMLVWTTDAEGNVPSTVTPIDVQFRSDPWLPDEPESNTNSNDYSYREDLGSNDKVVLCLNVDGKWTHVQGTPPSYAPDPCNYVNNCDAALSCDPL